MGKGAAERKFFPGMARPCAKCSSEITVTAQMCKYGKYVCRPCQSKASVEWAKQNREKKRSANNAYHARRSADRADATRAYRERHPLKRVAHQAVQTAIRNGSIVRQPCERCGRPDAHAHHDDYTQPLSVNWLCHSHHMERHTMLAERAKASS